MLFRSGDGPVLEGSRQKNFTSSARQTHPLLALEVTGCDRPRPAISQRLQTMTVSSEGLQGEEPRVGGPRPVSVLYQLPEFPFSKRQSL